MSDLKPCPFCGGTDLYTYWDRIKKIDCRDCGLTLDAHIWNNRPKENKIKAEAIREATSRILGYAGTHESSNFYAQFMDYANKLEECES